MLAVAALDVAIPLMLEDSQMDMYPGDVGRLLTICSACYLVGKLSTGYSVDRLGAKFVFLWLASFTSAVLTGLVSTCQGTHRLTLTVCAMFVAQSSGERLSSKFTTIHLLQCQCRLEIQRPTYMHHML